MITAIMLLLMTGPAVLVRAFASARQRRAAVRTAAAVGLGLMFLFISSGHFFLAEPMAKMLPPWVPARIPLVYLTGVLEGAIAIGFFVPNLRRVTGWAAIIMLALFFPANIYAAMNHIPLGGHAWGPIYLLVRAPLQATIMFWIYWFTIIPDDTIAVKSVPPQTVTADPDDGD